MTDGGEDVPPTLFIGGSNDDVEVVGVGVLEDEVGGEVVSCPVPGNPCPP